MDTKIIEFMEIEIKTKRKSLTKDGLNAPQTYKSGFDIGYSLGTAHAYEKVLRRFNVEQPAEPKTQEDTLKASDLSHACSSLTFFPIIDTSKAAKFEPSAGRTLLNDAKN